MRYFKCWKNKTFEIKIKGLLIILSSILACVTAANAITVSPELLESAKSPDGQPAKDKILEWVDLVNNNRHEPELVKLKLANRFFNQLQYVPDSDLWGKMNYWSTPLEFITFRAGDSEDYAIAKYFTLKAMGVPINKMRLTFVKSLKLNQAHMVLTYYESPGSEPFILDNKRRMILYASERPDLKPIYSFNGDGLWQTSGMGKSAGGKVGKSRGNKMKLWVDLKKRMKQEGFDL